MLARGIRQVVAVDRQEPVDVGALKFELAAHLCLLRLLELDPPDAAEKPHQQIEEVDANVGGDATRTRNIAFPRVTVPRTARCDVAQLHLPTFVRCGKKLISKRDERRVRSEERRVGKERRAVWWRGEWT